jgi:hypothetical protein
MRKDRPGYKSRSNKDGSLVHYWDPRRAVKGVPASLSAIRLADDMDDEAIAAECRRLTMQLRDELSKLGAPPSYDGTVKALIEAYKFDTTSSLHTVKHSTRVRDYEPSLRVLEENIGTRRIDVLKASDFKKWFSEWRKRGHRRAAGAIKLLRLILSYGAGERLHGCAQARLIMSDLMFEQPAGRSVVMTYDQCLAIVQASAKLGCPSIGFTEALKFETALRRIDVIGEWSPPPEGGAFRWRGLTARDISKDSILSIETSKTSANVARDLNVMPLVTEALKAYAIPEIGPVVIDEDTGEPYRDNHYTVKFRKVRKAAGVPDNVWSMDSRAGAITETIEATGSIEEARVLATHTTAKMTERYSRGNGLSASRKLAELRVENRK